MHRENDTNRLVPWSRESAGKRLLHCVCAYRGIVETHMRSSGCTFHIVCVQRLDYANEKEKILNTYPLSKSAHAGTEEVRGEYTNVYKHSHFQRSLPTVWSMCCPGIEISPVLLSKCCPRMKNSPAMLSVRCSWMKNSPALRSMRCSWIVRIWRHEVLISARSQSWYALRRIHVLELKIRLAVPVGQVWLWMCEVLAVCPAPLFRTHRSKLAFLQESHRQS